MIVYTSMHF